MTILFVWARSIVLGWATLLVLAYGAERPLLRWGGNVFGPSWFATVHVALDCMVFFAAGRVAGQFNQKRAVWTALLLIASLSFWDFSDLLDLNVPWLLQLSRNAVGDSRFMDSLLASLETHAVLFGCLMAGAVLSRPRAKMTSIREMTDGVV